MSVAPRARRAARRPPPGTQVTTAFERLARARALQTLVRGAVPLATLKRLLKDALPRGQAREMPDEVWASLATGMAAESPIFGLVIAEILHDRLAWDRAPQTLDDWWALVRDRPLEALWMAALSEDKSVRKEFVHMARHCLENYRDSPDCQPPSWQFIEALLDVQAASLRDVRDAERRSDEAERRRESERERLEELRDELKRLRRENAVLRTRRAQAERRAQEEAVPPQDPSALERRIEDLERRLRKADKEREHLLRELERERLPRSDGAAPVEVVEESPEAGDDGEGDHAGRSVETPIGTDPNPRRRLLRQMLRKLIKKGKIGASHTHEDNVYRGVVDHEKGLAKEAMDLLYREGFFVPKPTLTDPHVSLSPERIAEARAVIAGEIRNPRLRRFVEA